MQKLKMTYYCLVLMFVCYSFLFAQSESNKLTTKISGTIQSWGSYAQTNSDSNLIGFGLRRVRGRANISFGDHIKGFVQYEATTFKLLDARIEYHFSPNLQVRVGRFIGAGLRSGGLTIHTKIDIVERANSALIWARKSVGADYRDFGAEIISKFGDFTGRIWLHNGDGSINLKPSQRVTATTKNESIAVSGMGIFKPKSIKGLELGGHFGKGNGDLAKDYIDYSAFVYYEPRPIRLKAEFITLREKDSKITVSGLDDLTFIGYYIFGAYQFAKNVEVLGRYEVVDEDNDEKGNEETLITIGGSYSFYPEKWIASKITGAYVVHNEGNAISDTNNNIFYLMWQLVF